MTQRALQVCSAAGCGVLVRASRCDEHEKQRKTDTRKAYSRQYTESYNYKWSITSKRYRKANPLCVSCLLADRITPAMCVDHIVPHKGRNELFKNRENWCSLCWGCHSYKTRKEDSISDWTASPWKLVLCGLPATGKTTEAERLAQEWGCDVWDWDTVAKEAGLSLVQTWSASDWKYLLSRRREWITKHKPEDAAIAIVSRPVVAMQLACQIGGAVRHLTCAEAERQKRITKRNKEVGQWRKSKP
jgi:5-methylcytosine-specific restriction protein A